MTTYFSPHAQDRAREQYGLELSAADIWDILCACKDGRGFLAARTDDEAITYIVRAKGKNLVAVISARPGPPFLITFLPHDHFTAGTMKRRHTMGVNHGAPNVFGRQYKRPKSNQLALRALAEEP